MEEFKDSCKGLDVRMEEIAADLQELPTDYKLAERYTQIDQEIYEMTEWYKKVKQEKKWMEERLERADKELRFLNNDIQRFKLREFSRAQRGGSYSQLLQNRHP
jgi:DNA-binding transcriptional regulator GbsR (MarR family)